MDCVVEKRAEDGGGSGITDMIKSLVLGRGKYTTFCMYLKFVRPYVRVRCWQ